MKKERKSFQYHWGSGYVAEEAQIETEHHVPTIQLLVYTDGPAAGSKSIRFCHYSHSGRFMRSPLMISTEDIDDLRKALEGTPELKSLLEQFTAP